MIGGEYMVYFDIVWLTDTIAFIGIVETTKPRAILTFAWKESSQERTLKIFG